MLPNYVIVNWDGQRLDFEASRHGGYLIQVYCGGPISSKKGQQAYSSTCPTKQAQDPGTDTYQSTAHMSEAPTKGTNQHLNKV
jgi:hypothetical protein